MGSRVLGRKRQVLKEWNVLSPESRRRPSFAIWPPPDPDSGLPPGRSGRPWRPPRRAKSLPATSRCSLSGSRGGTATCTTTATTTSTNTTTTTAAAAATTATTTSHNNNNNNHNTLIMTLTVTRVTMTENMDPVIGFVIMVNALSIGLQADYSPEWEGWTVLQGEPQV